jgi:hypothetical protein
MSYIGKSPNVSGGGGGASGADLVANSVGASELKVTDNGTDNQILSSDGAGSFTWEDLPAAGAAPKTQVFIANGTYVVPGGTTTILITGTGGGGGGGTAYSAQAYLYGGSGGSGAVAYRAPVAVTAGMTINVTIGTGGSGGSNTSSWTPAQNNSSTAGVATTLVNNADSSTLCSLGGGSRGNAITAFNTAPSSSSGGTASGFSSSYLAKSGKGSGSRTIVYDDFTGTLLSAGNGGDGGIAGGSTGGTDGFDGFVIIEVGS